MPVFACHMMHMERQTEREREREREREEEKKTSWKATMNPILLSVFPCKLRTCHVYQYIFTSANCVHVLYTTVFIISAAAGFCYNVRHNL